MLLLSSVSIWKIILNNVGYYTVHETTTLLHSNQCSLSVYLDQGTRPKFSEHNICMTVLTQGRKRASLAGSVAMAW